MTVIPRDLSEHFARHHGVVSLAALAGYGLSTDQVRRLCHDGELVRVHNGVYRSRSAPDTLEARCVATSAAHPMVAVTGRSAGRLMGLRRMGAASVLTALAPMDGAPSLKGVRVRRTGSWLPQDAVERPDGIRLVAPPRLFFELAIDLSDDALDSVLEQLLERFLIADELVEARDRLAVAGRRGAARANRVLARRGFDDAPAQSELELRVVRALERRGIRLVRQHPLALTNGVTIHLDGADPTIGWGLEVDHLHWHGGRADVARDHERDRQARRAGWQVDRVTNVELGLDFHATIEMLVGLHAERAAAVADLKRFDGSWAR